MIYKTEYETLCHHIPTFCSAHHVCLGWSINCMTENAVCSTFIFSAHGTIFGKLIPVFLFNLNTCSQDTLETLSVS